MSQSSDTREFERHPIPPDRGPATLEEVDIRSELRSRPCRPPNYEGEHRALATLATEMAENPRNMLQKLVEIAVELCRADTAGISILEGDVFRWESLAGVFASRRNNTMPRQASPCGVCIDQNSTQLMYLADRCFPALLSEPRFVEALLVPFQHHGKPVGTVWIVSHNYERKFDSEDARVVRILARFAAAGWQLWKAYNTEAESSRIKDEFVAMLGHELRNPLAAILNANDVLQKLGVDDPDVTQAVDIVARQSHHLSRMVEDLVDLSRIAHGKLTLHKERVELKTVIDHAVETTHAQIERHQHRLSIKYPAERIVLDADPVRLAQLLSNLVDNAAKYTGDGGEISVTAELAGDQLSIAVRDTGVGIPKNQIGNIFELFTQLRGSPAAAPRDLGMGLALVRTLAELHGGSVEVVSGGLGEGSLFTVRLPISADASAGNQPAPTSQLSVEQTVAWRILLVEDNADIAESMGTLLAIDGHTISIAKDGVVALEMLHSFEPELVLLDIGLPGIDGYEVARRMRAETGHSNLVIVSLSGYGEEQHRRRSIEAGCDNHLVKPVQPDALRTFLARLGAPSRRSWNFVSN